MPVRLDVPSIACAGCAELLTERIGALAGVEAVQVDVAAKTVTVTGTAGQDELCAAIGEAGHRVG